MEQIKKINIEDIIKFKNHPFKVEDNEFLNDLVQSIRENGLLNPMVDSNLQSGKILLSEKAFTYKMKLDVINIKSNFEDTMATSKEKKFKKNLDDKFKDILDLFNI